MKKTPTAAQKAFLRGLTALWPLAKGSLALVRRPCIRPKCAACARGEKHAAWTFSFRQGGRQHCRYVPKDLAPLLRQGIANGRLVEAILTQAGADLIEHHRRERGGRQGHE